MTTARDGKQLERIVLDPGKDDVHEQREQTQRLPGEIDVPTPAPRPRSTSRRRGKPVTPQVTPAEPRQEDLGPQPPGTRRRGR